MKTTKKEFKRLDRQRRKGLRRFAARHTAKYSALVESTDPFQYPKTYLSSVDTAIKVRG